MNMPTTSRSAAFVNYVFQRCQQDKGFAARLRRGDNPATEYQCWDTLAAFGVNLEFVNERQPFALTAAAIARSTQKTNGGLKLGQAIARSFDDGNQSDQARARLRRLLACDDVEELCRILRPLLSLIQNRVQQIDYASFLEDLCWFDSATMRVKTRWAQQFYGKSAAENQGDA
ncbi:type I-E CRISPR-associated protein Cse2/CasB [Leclercia sp.]|uniref:type I-E CRISPR-associated protein Cse2/CasB n=1 Tax=Leclercia sp. TaxID=1898428 RepID=UPI002FDD8FE1